MPKILFYLLAILFAGSSPAASEVSCVTADCHQVFRDERGTHPEETACGECHHGDVKAHAEQKADLDLTEKICGGCHLDLVRHEYTHPPAAEGACYVCHSPHGDMKRKLLPEEYPAGFYEDYRKDSYGMCFACHKRIIIRFPDTTYATGFRDGKRNLHYVHVNKDNRGRTCKLCHEVHGSDNPGLIAEFIQFGEWEMEMNFEKKADGGRCAPGCHRPLSYSRTEK